jgi:RNA polymerase sigma-70 factor (ECF subfamily)
LTDHSLLKADADRAAAPRLAAKLEGDALFVDLMRRYQPVVEKLCRLLLRDRWEAEDAAQQTFLLAYQSLLSGVRPLRPRAWLCTIARHECWTRRERPKQSRIPESASSKELEPWEQAALKADLAAVVAELGRLPGRQRRALVLRELAGLSYRQLAAALNISEPAADALLIRARRRLRRPALALLPLPSSLSLPRSLYRTLRQVARWPAQLLADPIHAAAAATIVPVAAASILAATGTAITQDAKAAARAPAGEVRTIAIGPVGGRHLTPPANKIAESEQVTPALAEKAITATSEEGSSSAGIDERTAASDAQGRGQEAPSGEGDTPSDTPNMEPEARPRTPSGALPVSPQAPSTPDVDAETPVDRAPDNPAPVTPAPDDTVPAPSAADPDTEAPFDGATDDTVPVSPADVDIEGDTAIEDRLSAVAASEVDAEAPIDLVTYNPLALLSTADPDTEAPIEGASDSAAQAAETKAETPINPADDAGAENAASFETATTSTPSQSEGTTASTGGNSAAPADANEPGAGDRPIGSTSDNPPQGAPGKRGTVDGVTPGADPAPLSHAEEHARRPATQSTRDSVEPDRTRSPRLRA